MTETILKSGATLVINVAPFEDAKRLWDAVQRVAATRSISLDAASLSGLLTNLAMAVDSTPEFNVMLWPCLIRCTYNSRKIEKSIFEDMEARKEYYDIIAPCVETNVRPFADSLFSTLNAQMEAMTKEIKKDGPKSE